nr:GspH/FimT family pseudopilin [Thiocapsa sp.]
MRGVTLIELMVSLIVLAILIGIGVPSFQSIMQRDRVTDATNDLLMALQLARSDAVRLRTKATVCASNDDQTSCYEEEDKPPWSYGWLLIIDDELTRIGAIIGDGVTIGTTPALIASIEFEADGSASIIDFSDKDLGVGNFEIDSAAKEPRCIRILKSGFVSMEKMACPTD